MYSMSACTYECMYVMYALCMCVCVYVWNCSYVMLTTPEVFYHHTKFYKNLLKQIVKT